jgi:hypothetical protein
MKRYSDSEEEFDERMEYRLDRMKEGRFCQYYDDRNRLCKIGNDECIGNENKPKECEVFLEYEN